RQGRTIRIGTWINVGAPRLNPISPTSSIPKDAAKITKPNARQTVPWSFEVEGTAKDIPADYNLWIFTTAYSGGSPRYWPQDRVLLKDGHWSGRVHGIGGPPTVHERSPSSQ